MSGYYVAAHVTPDEPIEFRAGPNNVSVHAGDLSIVMGHRHGPEGVAWLRSLAVACLDAAEEQERVCGEQVAS